MVWPTQQPERNYIGSFPFNRQMPPDNSLNRIIPVQKMQSFLSPERIGSITNTLTKVQQVLKTVENAAPIIQQYGPMVKNLPMMFKIMKALKESDDVEIDDVEEEEFAEENIEEDTFYEHEEELPGSSKPKLFI
ncbi:VrrA/YqfQ family protein [Virgibacillus ihumii]|uniref:VrrA/YqfQ family protein n=1 Tax=Virgibacillus ihumii TaxID=2686091 RepID=UPI00157DE161|nr:VrrA/YqfQ family protein [Virgibacillus ihumii]